MVSTNEEPQTDAAETLVDGRATKVDLPQQYKNWRDYAFSEYPEDRDSPQR